MTNGNMAPHRGALILALGIISLVTCQILGIAPWILGKSDLAAMDAGTMDPSGRDTTKAGMICGIVATIITVLGALAVILMFALGGFAFILDQANR